MRCKYIRFVVAEEILMLPFLTWAYALAPTRGDLPLILFFAFFWGLSSSASFALIYLLNKDANWGKLRMRDVLFRLAFAIVTTDAVFYAVHSIVYMSTGLWIDDNSVSVFSIIAGVGLGFTGMVGMKLAKGFDCESAV